MNSPYWLPCVAQLLFSQGEKIIAWCQIFVRKCLLVQVWMTKSILVCLMCMTLVHFNLSVISLQRVSSMFVSYLVQRFLFSLCLLFMLVTPPTLSLFHNHSPLTFCIMSITIEKWLCIRLLWKRRDECR